MPFDNEDLKRLKYLCGGPGLVQGDAIYVLALIARLEAAESALEHCNCVCGECSYYQVWRKAAGKDSL